MSYDGKPLRKNKSPNEKARMTRKTEHQIAIEE